MYHASTNITDALRVDVADFGPNIIDQSSSMVALNYVSPTMSQAQAQ
jgi:hypothetical protein